MMDLNYVSFALIAIALVLLLWVNWQLVRATDELALFKNTRRETKAPSSEQTLLRIERLSLQLSSASRQRPSSHYREEPEEPPAKPERRLDPLQDLKSQMLSRLRSILNALNQWSSAVRVNLYQLVPGSRQLSEIESLVIAASQPRQLDRLDGEIEQILQELLRVAIKQSDLTLDRERTNDQLQRALRNAVEYAGYSMIDPDPGSVLDRAAHTKINVKPGTPEQRGRIAEVRHRGLQDKLGNVIEPAEVSEFY